MPISPIRAGRRNLADNFPGSDIPNARYQRRFVRLKQRVVWEGHDPITLCKSGLVEFGGGSCDPGEGNLIVLGKNCTLLYEL